MKLSYFSLAIAATLATGTAFAQQYTVKAGAAYINPNATSSDLTGSMALNLPGGLPTPRTVTPNVQLEVQPQTAFIFSIARAFGDNWEGELLLGFPPEHKVKMRMNNAQVKTLAGMYDPSAPNALTTTAKHIADYDGKVVAKLKQFAPTAFVNYRFGTSDSTFRPYVGVGVNFTHVEPDPTSAGEAFYNDGKVRTKVSDSWGLALQAGLTYHIDDQWLVNAAYATAQVKNKIRIETDTAGSVHTAKYKFNPSIWMFTVGRKF